MNVLRQITPGEILTPSELAQGAMVLDNKQLVVLDEAERKIFESHKALIARDYADHALGLTREFVESNGGLLAAAFPSVPLDGLTDVYFVAELLRPLVPAYATDEFLAAVPPLFRAHMLDEPVDYKAVGSPITIVSIWGRMLEDPVKEVSRELLSEGDPRIGKWVSKEVNGLDLMLSIRRSENIYLRKGVVKRLTPAEMALEREALAAQPGVPPAFKAVGATVWAELKPAMIQVFPELEAVAARLEASSASVPKEDYAAFAARSMDILLMAMAAAARKSAAPRDLAQLAALPRTALDFLADPKASDSRLYLRRVLI
jgi:hypothetical protein